MKACAVQWMSFVDLIEYAIKVSIWWTAEMSFYKNEMKHTFEKVKTED